VNLEDQATSIIRVTAIICCGAIVLFGIVFLLTEELLLFLDFSAEQSREGALVACVATAVVAFLVLVVKTPVKEGSAGNESSTWKHTEGLRVEPNKWYQVCQKDDAGVYHSTMPEHPADFTGVIRTFTGALLYVRNKRLPADTVAWLIPDEEKFVALAGNPLPPPSNSLYLLDSTCGSSVDGRVCCTRHSERSWHSEDGRNTYYSDSHKMVARWLPLPDPEAS